MEVVAKAAAGGYCWLRIPLRLARPGGGGGYLTQGVTSPPLPMHPCLLAHAAGAGVTDPPLPPNGCGKSPALGQGGDWAGAQAPRLGQAPSFPPSHPNTAPRPCGLAGIIITRTSKYSLLVDPQGQGLQWLRAREEPNGVKVSKFSDRFFADHLRDQLRDGRPLLIENCTEDIDPMLDPVLEKVCWWLCRWQKVYTSPPPPPKGNEISVHRTKSPENPGKVPKPTTLAWNEWPPEICPLSRE